MNKLWYEGQQIKISDSKKSVIIFKKISRAKDDTAENNATHTVQ